MKILCEYAEDEFRWVRLGVKRVMETLGHQFIGWDSKTKPAFDAFDEVEPTLFIACPRFASDVQKCLNERQNKVKVYPIHEMKPAADTFMAGGRRDNSLACQVAYVGDYNPNMHNTYLLPLCHRSAALQVKICGTKPWPVAQYLGPIADETIPDFYASAKVSLNFSGPEGAYQILISGGLPISKKFEDEAFEGYDYLMADSPINMAAMVGLFASDKTSVKVRGEMIAKGVEVIRQGNTYWHRVAELFDKTGYEHEAKRTMKIYEAASPL
jgi:hypothetical protein